MAAVTEHPLHAGLDWHNAGERSVHVSLGEAAAGWVSGEALARCDSPLLSELLDYEGRFQRGVDAKTRAAYLITQASGLVAGAVTAPYLMGSAVPDFSPGSLAYRFEDYEATFEGRDVTMKRPYVRLLSECFWTDDTAALHWPGARPETGRTALRARFTALLEAHFRPFVDALNALTRLPPSAQWRLVADAVSARFLDVGRRLGMEETAKEEAMAILKVPGSPLCNRQLHYFDLAIPLGEGPDGTVMTRSFRARGGCCRYYLTEGGHLCTTCVLEKPAERDRRLRQAVLQRLAARAEA